MSAVDENMIIDVVDERDTSIGVIRRRDVLRQHVNFRVVHILVFNARGDLLVQRLARTRTRHPGYWGSSVAGYVFAEENYWDAAKRRLAEELGVRDATLQYLGKDTMLDEDSHKFIGVFATTNNGPFQYDHEHIDRIEILSLAAIHDLCDAGARQFTPTFLHVLRFYEDRHRKD